MPEFVRTQLKLVDFRLRWGHVVVRDAAGRVIRQHRIPAGEVADIQAGAAPSCCNREEWAMGRVEVHGRALLPGQACVTADGALRANYRQAGDGAGFRLDLREFPRGAWALHEGAIAVADGYGKGVAQWP